MEITGGKKLRKQTGDAVSKLPVDDGECAVLMHSQAATADLFG